MKKYERTIKATAVVIIVGMGFAQNLLKSDIVSYKSFYGSQLMTADSVQLSPENINSLAVSLLSKGAQLISPF